MTHSYCPIWLQIGDSQDPLPQVQLWNLLVWLTELRETFTSLVKDMIKDTDEQPGLEGSQAPELLSHRVGVTSLEAL